MASTDGQRIAYRERFRSLYQEEFQAWFEQLARALHPAGDFQRIRKTRGDGGLDGIVISSRQVYQVYAPRRLDDAKVAAKIRKDFATARSTLDGKLLAWTFVHNDPEAAIGKQTAKAIQDLQTDHPGIEFKILDIDSLWDLLVHDLPGESLDRLFPKEQVAPDRYVLESHTARASCELDRIRRRRGAAPEEARREIAQLAARLADGDLLHTAPAEHARVLYWAAWLHATRDHLDKARGFHDQLLRLGPLTDLTVLDSLLLEASGDADGALHALREIDSVEGRSVLFGVLHRTRGPAAALAWFDSRTDRRRPDFFTGFCWWILGLSLADAGRWEEARTYLAEVHELWEDCPHLPFVEGQIRAAFLLPVELRRHALDDTVFYRGIKTIEGAAPDRERASAMASFYRATELWRDLHPPTAEDARAWQTWLQLTDPRPEVRAAARTTLQQEMTDGKGILRHLLIASAFDIPFDTDKAWRHLTQRAALGGLDDGELRAEFVLAQMTKAPRDLLGYLEREGSRLGRAVPAAALALARIQASTEDGQTARARSFLEEARSLFEPEEIQRIEAQVDAQEGIDPRQRLEALHAQTDSLLDLKALIQHLASIGDWTALRPRLAKLLRLEPVAENLCNLVHCMLRPPETAADDVLAILEEYRELVEGQPDLQSAKAWALFRVGRLKEADELNRRLLLDRFHAEDLDLEINLALASGRWEDFAAIVGREWPRRDAHPAGTLMRLASLAANTDTSTDRAWELAKLAVDKGGADPHLLMSAISLTYRLGRDREPEASAWLSQALALSADAGPLQKMDLPTLVQEFLPARREHIRVIEERWLRGEIPIHFAAAQLNVPLSHLLIAIPRANETVQDGRRRILLPIVSEIRPPRPVLPGWAIGLDVSSLMVLAHLGLLARIISTFPKILIAPETLLLLLNERNRVRFHQPARIAAAQALRRMLDEGRLKEAEAPHGNIQELAGEVGTDLAQLLQAAQERGGRVVRPLPVHKRGSLMTELAALGKYDSLICSTVDLEQVLADRGHLEGSQHQRARHYLLSQDRPSAAGADISLLGGPLYLDELAVTFLQAAELLPAMVAADLDLRVHPSLRQDTNRLIATSDDGDELAVFLDELRVTLRNGLEAGKIDLLPRHDDTRSLQPWIFDAAPTVLQLLEDCGSCDAICIDDRVFNKSATLTDRRGRTVPVVCVLDLFVFLETHGALQPAEGATLRHRFRRSGFVFQPLLPAELASAVATARWRDDDGLIESAELRVLRQSLAKLRAVPPLHDPVKQPLASALLAAAVLIMRQLWEDHALTSERAAQLSAWLWHHVAPAPRDWLDGAADTPGSSAEALAQQLTLLLLPLASSVAQPRYTAYLDWLEGSVLEPLLPANPGVLARLGELGGRQIEHWASDAADNAAAFAHWLYIRQPRLIRDWLAENFAFRPELRFQFQQDLSIGDMATFQPEALFSAARRLWVTHNGQTLSTVDGARAVLTLQDGVVCLHLTGEGGETHQLHLLELEVISEDRGARLDACGGILRRLGPTSPEIGTLCRLADERPFTDDELRQLIRAVERAAPPRQERLREALARGPCSLHDLVPDSLAYFERFCGPDPGASDPETYLTSTLPDHRRELLRRDLTQGLRICLLSALRDDLCPGEWLEPYGDNEVWSALQECQPEAEPLSLLAALDIALSRQHDPRFAELADKAISALLGATYRLPGGGDFYRLFPPLMELALQTITYLPAGMARPPFWRRMCAWMQAALVTRLMSGDNLDLAAVDRNLTPAGQCAKLVDLRQEPLVHPGQLSPQFLRAEVLGRLWFLARRHSAAGRRIPQAEEIEQALRRRDGDSSPYLAFMPGPLDGYRRFEAELPAAIEAQLADVTAADLAQPLVILSRSWRLPEELRSRLRTSITEQLGAQDPQRQLSRCEQLALVAAAERDPDLANAVATAAVALAPRLRAPDELVKLIHSLLIAAAAMPDEAAWAGWLQRRLGELADQVSAGQPAVVYWHYLDFLRRVTKLDLAVDGRAAVLASAAMY